VAVADRPTKVVQSLWSPVYKSPSHQRNLFLRPTYIVKKTNAPYIKPTLLVLQDLKCLLLK